MVDQSPARPGATLKVSATSRYAIGDIFNLMLIIMSVVFILAGMWRLFVAGFQLTIAILVLLAPFALGLYLRGILHRTIEVTPQGVRYQTAFKERFIDWTSVEAVKIEPRFRQVTFWTGAKTQRIHTFGLSPADHRILLERLIDEVKARRIQGR